MSVRSSTTFPLLAAMAAGLLAVAPALAQPVAASDALTAGDLPDLGDPVASASVAQAAPPAQPVPVKTRLVVARLSLDTPVSRLCADPRAKAVLDSDLPGLTTRPEFPFFKSMSLNTLRKMSRGKMSEADLAKVQAELAHIDETPAAGADQ